MKLILGSGSPRRKEILQGIFGEVQVVIPAVDESLLENETACEYVERVTNSKMDAVVTELDPTGGFCIITADTIVSIENKILGKPASREEASAMLRMLSANEHTVITGISVVFKQNGRSDRFYSAEKTSVRFKMLSDEIIDKYLDMVSYSDKAGSYAIQENGDLLVESVKGSMTNVIGFPLRLFFKIVKESGFAGDLRN